MVQIPANTTAVLYLPEKEGALELGSGTYSYEYETTTSLRELRFTLDSKLGEILAEPLGMKMMEQMVPHYEAVLKALNEQEKK